MSHFLFLCPSTNVARQYMLDQLLRICSPTVEILLYGDINRTVQENTAVFKIVHEYIRLTKRFT